MANYYQFTPVSLESFGRTYVAQVKIEVPGPGQPDAPLITVRLLFTDSNGVPVKGEPLRESVVSEQDWEAFLVNYSALPGTGFVQKIVQFSNFLNPLVPAGGTLGNDDPA